MKILLSTRGYLLETLLFMTNLHKQVRNSSRLPGGVCTGGCLLLGGVCSGGGVPAPGGRGGGGGGGIPACTEADPPWTQTGVKT